MGGGLRNGVKDIFYRPEKNNEVLDGVRAIAILYVILFHSFFFSQYAFVEKTQFVEYIDSLPLMLTWVWHGDMGVDIFFVLSGFLIGQHLMAEYQRTAGVDLRRFYRKRILRILPLYLFAIFLFAMANGPNRELFWANILLVNNFMTAEKIFIPWSWSLTIEGQFYILVPFLILLLTRFRIWMLSLVLLVFAATFYRYVSLAAEPVLYQQTLIDYFLSGDITSAVLYLDTLYIGFFVRSGPLLLGLMAAYLDLNYRDKVIFVLGKYPMLYWLLILAAISAIFWVVSYHSYLPSTSTGFSEQKRFWHAVLGRNIFALGFVVIMFSALYDVGIGRVFRKFFKLKVFVPVAQTSYSLYLFHPPFLFAAFFLVKGGDKITSLSLIETLQVFSYGLAMVFIFSMLTFIFIERPFMQLGKHKH